mmetsp:Transcript_6807/g.13954  ORF Transcript_6807/g.13954 Transcript_6807/m.13954 type:complete len:235 (-) Transcript_6807:1101-1805(-)
MRVPFGGVRRFVPFAAGICVPMPSSRFRVVVVVAVVVVVVVVVHPSSRRRPFHPRHVPEMREIGIDEVACAPRATCEGRLRIPRGGIGAIPRDVRIAVEAGRFRRRRRKTKTTIRRRGEERRSLRERLNRRRRRRGASSPCVPRPFLGVFEWSRSRDSVNDDDEEDDEEDDDEIGFRPDRFASAPNSTRFRTRPSERREREFEFSASSARSRRDIRSFRRKRTMRIRIDRRPNP